MEVNINLGGAAKTAELTGSETTSAQYFSSVLSGIMVVGALIVFFYLIWGGIEWITAGGDQSKIQKARDKITQSIIGLIVLSSTVALFMVVQDFVGIKII